MPSPPSIFKDLVRATIHKLVWLAAHKEPPPSRCGFSKVLLIVTGHIGDTVIASGLIPVLKSENPEVEVGFVVPSSSQMVIRNHHSVDRIHVVDHRIMNRNLAGAVKNKRYRDTRRQALSEIRAVGYEVAICLHPWRPDLLRLAWQAKIPFRAAFSNSLLAPLATHIADYPEDNPLVDHGTALLRLLTALEVSPEHLANFQPSLPNATEAEMTEMRTFLNESRISPGFAVIHVGSGVPAKEMPVEFWRGVCIRLAEKQNIVFTGSGQRESAIINDVISGNRMCVNAANKLSWGAFVALIRVARTVYTVDTMAGHVAAALGTPVVAAFGGNNGVGRWRPRGRTVTVWTNHVQCAPCRQMHGCKDMICKQNISPADVVGYGQKEGQL